MFFKIKMSNGEPRIYVKPFNVGGKPKEVSTKKFPFSTFFPPPMRKAFREVYGNHIRKNDYILGPWYKGGDFQFGVTGTLEVKEPFRNGVAREMGEEIGIVPAPTQKYPDALDQLIKIGGLYRYGRKQMQVYRLYIKDAIPVKEFEHMADLSKRRDDRMFKGGCFVYGSKEDILKFMNRRIYRYKSMDDLIGVAAVKAWDAYNHFY